MTDWVQIARARGLDIPEEAVERAAPALAALEAAFRPLAAKLAHNVEPAITLSEAAVLGE
jgi:hypothetical protein